VLGSFLYKSIDDVKKGIIIFQPSLSVFQVQIDFVCRNQAGQRFAPFCNQQILFDRFKLRKLE